MYWEQDSTYQYPHILGPTHGRSVQFQNRLSFPEDRLTWFVKINVYFRVTQRSSAYGSNQRFPIGEALAQLHSLSRVSLTAITRRFSPVDQPDRILGNHRHRALWIRLKRQIHLLKPSIIIRVRFGILV